MVHAHSAWYGNSAEDISVPSTEISTRLSKVSVLKEYGSELDEAQKYLEQRQGEETWNGYRTTQYAHRAWY